MPLNNGKWKYGTAGNNAFDMIGDQPYFWDVADNYDAGAGSDTVYGNHVDNTILLGAGDDWVNARWGNDTVRGGLNNDVVYGDQGADWLYGEEGNDRLYGGTEGDRLYGGANDDTLYGEAGSDWLDGGTGSDRIYGGTEGDTLGDGSSEAVYDRLDGGDGGDAITSLGGGDALYGGGGFDTISVGAANTFRLQGGTVSGGADTDTLVFRSATDVGLFSNVGSIERFDLRATTAQTLRLDFDEVRDISGTDRLTVYGGSEDRIVLDDTVAGDALNGGDWQAGPLSNPTSTGDRYQTWQYLDASGDATGIELTVNTKIDILLV